MLGGTRMTERLSAYELSLSALQLTDYCQHEAHRQWSILKSATPYVESQALANLFQRRPELYERYQAQVLRHEAPAHYQPAWSQEAALLTRDEARVELEAVAKQYLDLRLASDESEALTKAVQARPDLYTACTQPPATTPQDPDPLRELQRLARDYVAKRIEPTEQAGMERAIQERPDLYQAHAVSVQKVVR
jgi:hypothetical protein